MCNKREAVQRIVRLGGAVDDDMANLIVAQLLYLDSSDKRRDITMYVNSPGGSVTAGNSGTDQEDRLGRYRSQT